MAFLNFTGNYILLLVTVAIWLLLILATEWIYTLVMHALLRKRWKNSYRKIFRLYGESYSLSGQGYRKTVIFCISMAFALLFVIFASLPAGAAVPIINNGGDLLQLLYCIALSSGFVFVALFALNFNDKKQVFKKLIVSLVRLFIPFTACFMSIAAYLGAIGVAGDTYSIALLMEATPYNSMTKVGIAGLALFGFIIFSQIYSEERLQGEDCMLISMYDMPEFSGKIRFILQLWSLCIPYIVILLTEEIFFPWKYFARPTQGPIYDLLFSIGGFLLFWIVMIFLRIVVVGLCGALMQFLKKRISSRLYFFILPLLTLIAMGLVFYDTIKVAAEMYMY